MRAKGAKGARGASGAARGSRGAPRGHQGTADESPLRQQERRGAAKGGNMGAQRGQNGSQKDPNKSEDRKTKTGEPPNVKFENCDKMKHAQSRTCTYSLDGIKQTNKHGNIQFFH